MANEVSAKSEKPSSPKTRIVLIGGFLGAGKTTLIKEIGTRLARLGKSVAVITSNQGLYLLSARSAKEAGFCRADILDGCFCTWFPDLMNSISQAVKASNLDYIIAEPVMSCTDLLATVVVPLKTFYKGRLDIAPLFIVVDGGRVEREYAAMKLETPETAKEILASDQIREAQFLLLSKIDSVKDRSALEREIARIRGINPEADIIGYSATAGDGVEKIVSRIMESGTGYKRPASRDGKIRADGSDGLSRCIETWRLRSDGGVDALDFSIKLINGLAGSPLKVSQADVYLVSEINSVKISYIDGVIKSDGICNKAAKPKTAVVTLDVRARASPDSLSSLVDKLLADISSRGKIEIDDYNSETLGVEPPAGD